MKKSLLVSILSLVLLVAAGRADESHRTLFSAEGSPEGVVTAKSGDVCTDKSSAALYVKSGGMSNTGWVQLAGTNGKAITILSGTSITGAPVAGMVIVTASSAQVYLTTTTGFHILSGGTNRPF